MVQIQEEEGVQQEQDLMLEEPSAPSRQQSPLHFLGRAFKAQTTSTFRLANQMAVPGPPTDGRFGDEPEEDMVSFAPVYEDEGQRNTPAMFVPVVKGGVKQQGRRICVMYVLLPSSPLFTNLPLVICVSILASDWLRLSSWALQCQHSACQYHSAAPGAQ